MTTKQQVPEVTVRVSQPYVVIGGGWTGMRPQGMRRDYTADAFGHQVKKTSKSEIQERIRVLAYRETGSNRVRFTFTEA